MTPDESRPQHNNTMPADVGTRSRRDECRCDRRRVSVGEMKDRRACSIGQRTCPLQRLCHARPLGRVWDRCPPMKPLSLLFPFPQINNGRRIVAVVRRSTVPAINKTALLLSQPLPFSSPIVPWAFPLCNAPRTFFWTSSQIYYLRPPFRRSGCLDLSTRLTTVYRRQSHQSHQSRTRALQVGPSIPTLSSVATGSH